MGKVNEEYQKKNYEMFRELRSYKKGSKEFLELRNRIVEYNLGLVDAFLLKNKKYLHLERYDYNDAKQACSIGLIKAVEHFDVGYENQAVFSTYAFYWFMQHLKVLNNETYNIYVPMNAVGDERAAVKKCVELVRNVESLDKLYSDGDYLDDRRQDDLFMYGKRIDEEKESREREIVKAFDGFFDQDNGILDRERKMLLMYYSDDKMTLDEVGRAFNVTANRARQIIAKALRKLRHPCRTKKLRDFLYD